MTSTSQNRKSILIVDDEPDLLDVYSDILAGLNVNIKRASNGKEAWDELLASPTDLVITDVRMPVMDGMELLVKVSKSQLFVPVIVISAFGDRQTLRKAWSLGAFDFLDKPVDQKQMLSTVAVALAFGQSFIAKRESANELRANRPTTNIAIDAELAERIRAICQSEQVTESNFIERLLFRHLSSQP